MDFDDAWGGGCMAPVSPLGAVVSWEEEMNSDGEAKTVLAHSTLPMVVVVAPVQCRGLTTSSGLLWASFSLRSEEGN